VPVLAPTAPTCLLRGGGRVARVSSLAGVPASACAADMGRQDYSGDQRGGERGADRRLDCAEDPVSLTRLPAFLLALALALVFAGPGMGQVEKVAMRTSGISCGVCAAVSEVNFKRLPGVDQVKISLSQEAIMLTYKPGAAFSPRQIRDILRPLDVSVTQFQIGARGRVVEENGKPFFAAGKDKFLIAADGKFAELPRNATVFVEAILNDKAQPMEIKILDFKR
jgi:copper chaperone CopZ